MDLWDRLCCLLRARTVSVEDVSNKVINILQGFAYNRFACAMSKLCLHSLLMVHALRFSGNGIMPAMFERKNPSMSIRLPLNVSASKGAQHGKFALHQESCPDIHELLFASKTAPASRLEGTCGNGFERLGTTQHQVKICINLLSQSRGAWS